MHRPSREGPDRHLRLASAFARRRQDHLAELRINEALRLGAAPGEASEALQQLPSESTLHTRREALRRLAGLGAGGLAIAILPTNSLLSPATAAAQGTSAAQLLTGIYLRTRNPSSSSGAGCVVSGVGADGSLHSLATTTDPTAAVRAATGEMIAAAVGTDGTLSVSVQSPGASASNAFSLPPTLPLPGNAGLTLPQMALVGGTLFVLTTVVTTSRGPTVASALKGNTVTLSCTTQLRLLAVDIASARVLDLWQGPTVTSATKSTLRVSSDGAAVFIAAESPLASQPYVGHILTFATGQLTTSSTVDLDQATCNSFVAGKPYFWPAADATLVQVGGESFSTVTPAGGVNVTQLPTAYGNCRLPPVFQAGAVGSGAVASSGDGRIFDTNANALTVLPGSPSTAPPFLNYQGKAIGSVWASTASGPCVLDNREGLGGFWSLDQSARPASPSLSGSYLSSIRSDTSNRWVAALSPVEQVCYLVDTTTGNTQALGISSDTTLI